MYDFSLVVMRAEATSFLRRGEERRETGGNEMEEEEKEGDKGEINEEKKRERERKKGGHRIEETRQGRRRRAWEVEKDGTASGASGERRRRADGQKERERATTGPATLVIVTLSRLYRNIQSSLLLAKRPARSRTKHRGDEPRSRRFSS